jgi:hypothetical protein
LTEAVTAQNARLLRQAFSKNCQVFDGIFDDETKNTGGLLIGEYWSHIIAWTPTLLRV